MSKEKIKSPSVEDTQAKETMHALLELKQAIKNAGNITPNHLREICTCMEELELDVKTTKLLKKVQ